jgi:hypothetical protein
LFGAVNLCVIFALDVVDFSRAVNAECGSIVYLLFGSQGVKILLALRMPSCADFDRQISQ